MSHRVERDFVYTSQSSRVVFGLGSFVRLAEEVKALGARRALILCTPNQLDLAQAAAQLLGPLSAGVFAGAEMHVPIETARRAPGAGRGRTPRRPSAR